MGTQLPRAAGTDPIVITPRLWNQLADMVEQASKLFVAPPLELTDLSAGGKLISCKIPIQSVRAKVSGASGGGGKYTAKLLLKPTTTVTTAGNLSASELGDEGIDCYVFNTKEKGKSTHDLTQSPVVVDTFTGYIYTAADDGKPVVVIDGIDIKDCTTAPASTADFAPAEDPTVYHGLTGAAGEMAASAK